MGLQKRASREHEGQGRTVEDERRFLKQLEQKLLFNKFAE